MVKKIVIKIVGRQSIAFPKDLGQRERDEVYSKIVEVGRSGELEGGGRGILLNQGVNTVESSLPNSSLSRRSSPNNDLTIYLSLRPFAGSVRILDPNPRDDLLSSLDSLRLRGSFRLWDRRRIS